MSNHINIIQETAKENGETKELPTCFVEERTKKLLQTKTSDSRKNIGQFFTPKRMAQKAVEDFTIENNTGLLRLLDAGAGTGMLAIAAIERVVQLGGVRKIEISLIENDKDIIDILISNIDYAVQWARKFNVEIEYEILETDFTNFGVNLFKLDFPGSFDLVLSNPPYYKIKSNSYVSRQFSDFSTGQMNIFAIFMAIACRNVSESGKMICIIPMSFNTGVSFSKFRKYIFRHLSLRKIKYFKGRENHFTGERVLQRVMIIHFDKHSRHDLVDISELNIDAADDTERKVNFHVSEIISADSEIFIPPLSFKEHRMYLEIIEYPKKLKDYGLAVGTGSIVPHEDGHLITKERGIPLIWMHQITEHGLSWPAYIKKRENFIISESPIRKFLPKGEYILIRRCAFHGTRRHLYSCRIETVDGYENFALENHINYIYVNNFTDFNKFPDIFKLLEGYLKSEIVSVYLQARCFSTQVNARDIRELPIPDFESLVSNGVKNG